jgi:hypothetical protein
VRRSVGVVLLLTLAAFSASASAPPEALFDLGMRAFRAGDYTSAIVDLRAASEGFAAATGRAESYATALVYLALAQFRAGREDESRDTILRLAEAERVTPVFATLPLDTDAADFEVLVAALAPNAGLPRNPRVAAEDQTAPLPAVRPAAPVTEETVPAAATAASVEAATDVRIEEIQAETDRRIAAIEAEADRRIAEIQADADRRIAAAQSAANERVAAARAAANERVAAAERQAEREADARIAELEPRMPGVVPSGPAAVAPHRPIVVPETVETPAAPPSAPVPSRTASLSGSEALTALRRANDFVRAGEVAAAHELYVRLADDRNVPREVLAETGIGLYRIGSYDESVAAFRRMDAFARGEEDLRYYFAVALYETGAYREAQKELACALPFIQVTDDVARYRLKIEHSAAVNTARNF